MVTKSPPAQSNKDRYRKDLQNLIRQGGRLELGIDKECEPRGFEQRIRKSFGAKADEVLKVVPDFRGAYQAWYSEAKALIRQLLPDRIDDFVHYYEPAKTRKQIDYENYTLRDYLIGITVTKGPFKEVVVGPDAAVIKFQQQVSILRACERRFESTLFDIRQLVKADLLDSELDVAEELLKHGYSRAAGGMVGVVLEAHLAEVCTNHSVIISKKTPTIADFNDALKNANVIDTAQWRFLQHLADIRNCCAHKKSVEPTAAQVRDLIEGARKVTKTIV